jgi:hypothetical protein
MKLFFKGSIFKIAILLGGLFLVILQVSCSKEVAVSDLDFQKHLVGGTGSFKNTFKVWKLDSLSLDGKKLLLSASQKKYTKKFFQSGAYEDSDGFKGTWEITALNALKHITAGIKDTSAPIICTYEIIEVNSAQLSIKLLNTTDKYQYFFIISNSEN